MLPLVVAAVLVAVTVGVTAFAASVIDNQESRLLTERANEVNLVLTGSLSAVSTKLESLAEAYRIGGVKGFDEAAAEQVSTGSGRTALGLLRPGPQGYTVVAAYGRGLSAGQTVTGSAADSMRATQKSLKVTATRVYLSGGTRSVGFALGTTGGTVVFQQSLLGAVHPPSEAGTRAFSELRVVLFATAEPDRNQVVVATTGAVPLEGTVKYLPLMAGTTRWLTGVAARHPLVGSVAEAAPWAALGVGLAGSVLVFLLIEGMARRRDAAVEARASEHRFAESLQRRLLPAVPALAGLDVASVYVPGADYQQVGGDWFDVFELPSGQVAVVIGDVMGHDVEAAALMAQLRASLRSFASQGGDPSVTVGALARFMDLFAVPAVATTVFGILDPPDLDGQRWFRWSNAGHLPPLLRLPDGRVDSLDGALSPLLGAPSTSQRPVAGRTLPPGSTLLMYTDGLVEIQGESLSVTIAGLSQVLSRAGGATAGELCATVLAAQLPSRRHDDVALLVVKVTAEVPVRPTAAASDPEAASVTNDC